MNNAQEALSTVLETVSKSVIGQEHVVKALMIGLLTKGHVLLEGLPGTAKTRSIKALSEAINSDFGRVQFTPDLLPSDVTGSEVYREVDGKPSLAFQPGPIFNNLVLADEINRAPAKVQAALLEAMAEGTVTTSGKTQHLPELFMVLATQNPIEQEGTYPLPEAQMDRFALKVEVDYPDEEAELNVIRLVRSEETGNREAADKEITSVDPALILEAQQQVSAVHISEAIERYIVRIIMATRNVGDYSNAQFPKWISIGSSPRASIALDRCARANAWLAGRDFVEPDDVRAVIHSVLGHRLILSYDAIADQIKPRDVIDDILRFVAVG